MDMKRPLYNSYNNNNKLLQWPEEDHLALRADTRPNVDKPRNKKDCKYKELLQQKLKMPQQKLKRKKTRRHKRQPLGRQNGAPLDSVLMRIIQQRGHHHRWQQ